MKGILFNPVVDIKGTRIWHLSSNW